MFAKAVKRRLQAWTAIAITLVALSIRTEVQAQSEDSRKQLWPAANFSFETSERTRITATLEKHNGEDIFYKQEKVGVVFSFRMRRFGKHFLGDVDKENDYNLTIGGGYEFLRTHQNPTNRNEHRLLIQSTPKYVFGPNILAQDRNRVEFRWIDGVYNFRYRNKLTVERAFKFRRIKFSPFASGEVFWDRNRKSWNQNQYAFGIRLPFKKVFGLDVFYMHQNCTTCSSTSINILGLTGNFYFDWPYRKK